MQACDVASLIPIRSGQRKPLQPGWREAKLLPVQFASRCRRRFETKSEIGAPTASALMAIMLLAYEVPRPKWSLRVPEAERELLRSVFTGLDDVQIARLLVAGQFNDIAKGTTLTEENKPLDTLFFICEGHAKVTVAGSEIAHLEKGNFVGEIAFLTENPATATVVAEDSVRALVFDRGELNQFFRNEAEVAGLIYQLLGRELAQKLRARNIDIYLRGSAKPISLTANP